MSAVTFRVWTWGSRSRRPVRPRPAPARPLGWSRLGVLTSSRCLWAPTAFGPRPFLSNPQGGECPGRPGSVTCTPVPKTREPRTLGKGSRETSRLVRTSHVNATRGRGPRPKAGFCLLLLPTRTCRSLSLGWASRVGGSPGRHALEARADGAGRVPVSACESVLAAC